MSKETHVKMSTASSQDRRGKIRRNSVEQRVVFRKEQEIELVGWQGKDLKFQHTMT